MHKIIGNLNIVLTLYIYVWFLKISLLLVYFISLHTVQPWLPFYIDRHALDKIPSLMYLHMLLFCFGYAVCAPHNYLTIIKN